jgi:hypothetical protein
MTGLSPGDPTDPSGIGCSPKTIAATAEKVPQFR